MAKTDFKKVSIKQGKDLTVVNEKPVKYITVKGHNNKEFEICWDEQYNSFCINSTKTIEFVGEEGGAIYFKVK